MCFALSILLLKAVGLYAQDNKIIISGYVLDRDRVPIPFASVKVKASSIGTVTSLKGYYKLELKAQRDSLTLSFSCLGYKSAERSFPKLLTSRKLNVSLGEDVHKMEAVVIRGQQNTVTTLQTIGRDKLAAATGPTANVEAVIGTLQGVVQKNELSNKYNVRGGNFDENLVYINGIELYRPLLARSAEQEGLSAINPDLVGRVLFSSGGFTADYGDKLSSVLDITYRQPQRFEASAKLGAVNSSLHLGTKLGNLSLLSGVRLKRVANLLGNMDTKASYDPLYLDAQTYLNYKFNNHWQISLLANINATNFKFYPVSRKTTFGTVKNNRQLDISFDGKEADQFHTYLTALSLDYSPNSKSRHSIKFASFYSQERENFDIASEYLFGGSEPQGAGANAPKTKQVEQDDNIPNFEDTQTLAIGRTRNHSRNTLDYLVLSLRSLSQQRILDKWQVRYGVDIKTNIVKDHTEEWVQRDSLGYTTPLFKDKLVMDRSLQGDHRLQTYSLTAFGEVGSAYQLEDWGRLEGKLGLRSSYWSWSKKILFSPRVNLSFTPKDYKSLSYHFASGLYYQTPFYREMLQEKAIKEHYYSTELNRNIRSQAQAMTLLGVDYNFTLGGRAFKFTSEVFGKYLWRVNPYKQDNIKLKYLGENRAKAYVLGVDAKFYGEFVEGVDSWLSLSLMRARQSIDNSPYDIPLMNAPVLNCSLFFQDYFPHYKPIRLSLRAVYSSGLPIMHNGPNFDKLAFTSPAYKRVDIGLVYRLSEDAEGKARNILGTKATIDLGFDLFNVFDMLNTSSFLWIKDAYNLSYAVPNYLTRRNWNVYLRVQF